MSKFLNSIRRLMKQRERSRRRNMAIALKEKPYEVKMTAEKLEWKKKTCGRRRIKKEG